MFLLRSARMLRLLFVMFALAWLGHCALFCPLLQAETPLQFRLQAGDIQHEQLLVRCPLPAELLESAAWPASPAQLTGQLKNKSTGATVPFQIRQQQTTNGAEPVEILWRLETPLQPKEERCYEWQQFSDPQAPLPSSFSIRSEQGNLVCYHQERPLFAYNEQTDAPPAPLPSYYQRSGYVHPVYAPNGQILSDDFPPDHPHQHGLFFAWVNTTVTGQPVDFWNQQKQQGTVRHKKTRRKTEGPVFAELQVSLEHQQKLTSAEAQNKFRTVLAEDWTILVHQAQEWTVWELSSVQHNVLETLVVLNQYHYGGFGFRGQREWIADSKTARPAANFLTDSGKNRKSGNHTHARWVQLTAPTPSSNGSSDINSTPELSSPKRLSPGIVILGHPDNFRAPQKVRLHPEKPYFCFTPVVDEAFALEPQTAYHSRYLIVTFDSPPAPEKLDQLWQEYAQPMAIEISGNLP